MTDPYDGDPPTDVPTPHGWKGGSDDFKVTPQSWRNKYSPLGDVALPADDD